MTLSRRLLAASAALVAAAAPAAAQDIAGVRAFTLGVRGGASIPVGDLAEKGLEGGNATTGFNVAGMVTFASPALPVALRVEVGYDRFGTDVDPGDFGPDVEDVDATWSVISGTANAVLGLGGVGGVGVRPYLIGGVGVYRYELKVSGDIGDGVTISAGGNDTDVGVNGGLGLRFGLGSLSTFVEARIHHVFAEEALQFVPISVGLELRGAP